VLEAVTGHVAAVKPQSAFFERHGSAGVAVLEELLAAARAAGVLSILDVKRGDIGSTMTAYAQAHLLPGAPLEADAITVSPFLGTGSLDPAAELALAHGKGLFLLALTSNPDGPQVQHALTDGDTPVALEIARHAEKIGGAAPGEWSSIGLVVGATVGDGFRRLGLDAAAPSVPLLAPGVGAQGAGPSEVAEVFGERTGQALVSVSRGLLSAGPDVTALRERAEELAAAHR
jgi:orotidine-5'-phosphate decarboxylase